LRFSGNPAEVGVRLSQLTPTSAYDMRLERQRLLALPPATAFDQTERALNRDVIAVGLSAEGLSFLGRETRHKYRADFRAGFRNSVGQISNHFVDDWEDWPASPYHAIVICAAANDNRAQEYVQWLAAHFEGFLEEIRIEDGDVKREKRRDGSSGPVTEHFGFADGTSQPVFFDGSKRREQAQPLAHGFDPKAALNLVLVPEPTAVEVPDGEFEAGSYMAFAKIEQHPKAFNEAEKRLASLCGTSSDVAGAMIVGRQKNGCPLTGCRKDFNDFDRKEDPDGRKWPFASHTGKMNTRDGNGLSDRILRRGVTYQDKTTGRKGILFQSFQAMLKEQFELHLWWAVMEDRARAKTGHDPILGWGKQMFPHAVNAGDVESDISKLVTFRGGEYFYFPSIPAVWRLRFPENPAEAIS
jgi:deferrochelatase/peroxidase EfeB